MAELRTQDKARIFWRRWRLPITGFVIGLVAGPLISAWLGWQVASGTLREQVHDAVVTQQAELCEMLARAGADGLGQMDARQRIELAERHAQFPWVDAVDPEVVNRCSEGLAQEAAALRKGEGSA